MTQESFRKGISGQLNALVAKKEEEPEAKVIFPTTLSSADRKYVHRIAESFGLFTLSEGGPSGHPDRHIRVYVSDPTGEQTAKRGVRNVGGPAFLVPNSGVKIFCET